MVTPLVKFCCSVWVLLVSDVPPHVRSMTGPMQAMTKLANGCNLAILSLQKPADVQWLH